MYVPPRHIQAAGGMEFHVYTQGERAETLFLAQSHASSIMKKSLYYFTVSLSLRCAIKVCAFALHSLCCFFSGIPAARGGSTGVGFFSALSSWQRRMQRRLMERGAGLWHRQSKNNAFAPVL